MFDRGKKDPKLKKRRGSRAKKTRRVIFAGEEPFLEKRQFFGGRLSNGIAAKRGMSGSKQRHRREQARDAQQIIVDTLETREKRGGGVPGGNGKKGGEAF